MTDVSASVRSRRSRPPAWLFEGLDLLEQRRRALLVAVGVLVGLAVVVALTAPGILPPTPLVGAAVGVAALLLSVAFVVALDTADLMVRGPRHVRAAGGELVAVLPARADVESAAELAAAVQDVRPPDRTLLLGLAAATGDGRRSAAWAACLGRRLAQDDTSVLVVDLTGEGSDEPGFLETVRDGTKLTSVVTLDPDVRLARMGPGRDAKEALRAFVDASGWIPRDLDVLLVALPMAASRPVVRASLSLDDLLIVAERDRTSRVELIAGLDAVEAVGTPAQVILIDDAYAKKLGVSSGARTMPMPPDLESEPETPRSQGAPDRTDEDLGRVVEIPAGTSRPVTGIDDPAAPDEGAPDADVPSDGMDDADGRIGQVAELGDSPDAADEPIADADETPADRDEARDPVEPIIAEAGKDGTDDTVGPEKTPADGDEARDPLESIIGEAGTDDTDDADGPDDADDVDDPDGRGGADVPSLGTSPGEVAALLTEDEITALIRRHDAPDRHRGDVEPDDLAAPESVADGDPRPPGLTSDPDTESPPEPEAEVEGDEAPPRSAGRLDHRSQNPGASPRWSERAADGPSGTLAFGEALDGGEDTDRLPGFTPSVRTTLQDRDELTTTARLSRLMDEVEDRDSSGG